MDIFITAFSEDTNTLYRNRGDGTFEDLSWKSKLGPPSWLFLGWGTRFFDYDNDGWPDLIATNGHVYPEADRFAGGSTYRQRALLHRNLRNGTFSEEAGRYPALMKPGTGRGLAVGDYNNDGALDILVNRQDDSPQLLRNDLRGLGHWLEVQLIGAVNREGIGAVVTVTISSGKTTVARLAGDSYLSSGDPRLHFGLGDDRVATKVSVRWPSGKIQTLSGVTGDRILEIREPVE
jgi:enediyne biosynthesis protein E4